MTPMLETLISLDRLHCHFEGDGFGEGEPPLRMIRRVRRTRPERARPDTTS